MAKDRGWRPAISDGPGYELGWDSIIGSRDGILVDTGWLEGKEVHEPENWNPVKDLTTYLNDYKFIISYLRELKERYHLNFLGIGIDPHNAAGVMQDLETFDCPVVIITQSSRSLNDATVAVQLLTKSHSFEYDRKNELLTWSMINAAIVRNSFEEIKVDKKPGAKFKRIDPVDAVVDSHALMLLNKTEPVNIEYGHYC